MGVSVGSGEQSPASARAAVADRAQERDAPGGQAVTIGGDEANEHDVENRGFRKRWRRSDAPTVPSITWTPVAVWSGRGQPAFAPTMSRTGRFDEIDQYDRSCA